jgi:hypothetical protein
MGAGKLYDDGLTNPRLPGRAIDAAAGGGPAPTPPPPAAAPLPGMARALKSLRLSWKTIYVISACVMPDRSECWTAVSHDGRRVVTAGDWVSLGVLLRQDHGRWPDAGADAPPVEYQLRQLRQAFPGFAIIETYGGVSAFRGAFSWSADTASVVANMLANQRHEDARLQARLMRA